MRTQVTLLTGCLAAVLAAGSAWADKTSEKTSSSTSGAAASTAKSDTKDPVALAFRLPTGTKLNAKQEKAYDSLKDQYEATLRDAMEQLRSQDKAEKSKGLKLNRETRAQIKAGIKEILAMPYADAQKAAAANYSAQQNAGGYGNGGGHPSRPAGGPCPCGRR